MSLSLTLTAASVATQPVATSLSLDDLVSDRVIGPEDQLLQIYREISATRLDHALVLTNKLLVEYPNFQLAYLTKGDLLSAHTRELRTFGDVSHGPQQKLEALRQEAHVRLSAYRNRPPVNSVPRYLLQLRKDQKTAVVVDTQKSRLYVYENVEGRPRFLADYYISQGKLGDGKIREGDEKTPIGIYHVTHNIPREKLGDFYGTGALSLNYPNEWDKRQGRTGYGIWLHGVPSNTYSRPPRASNGCVVLSNQDLDNLYRQVRVVSTPIIISDHVEWLSLDNWNQERKNFLNAFESWRADWESLNTDKYLSHYSAKFTSERMSFAQWAARKHQVNAQKTSVKIKIENLSMLRYPGHEDMLMVTFDQQYRSNNLNQTTQKRQYWVHENGQWRVLYESTV